MSHSFFVPKFSVWTRDSGIWDLHSVNCVGARIGSHLRTSVFLKAELGMKAEFLGQLKLSRQERTSCVKLVVCTATALLFVDPYLSASFYSWGVNASSFEHGVLEQMCVHNKSGHFVWQEKIVHGWTWWGSFEITSRRRASGESDLLKILI
jgi:hypothetical protein